MTWMTEKLTFVFLLFYLFVSDEFILIYFPVSWGQFLMNQWKNAVSLAVASSADSGITSLLKSFLLSHPVLFLGIILFYCLSGFFFFVSSCLMLFVSLFYLVISLNWMKNTLLWNVSSIRPWTFSIIYSISVFWLFIRVRRGGGLKHHLTQEVTQLNVLGLQAVIQPVMAAYCWKWHNSVFTQQALVSHH